MSKYTKLFLISFLLIAMGYLSGVAVRFATSISDSSNIFHFPSELVWDTSEMNSTVKAGIRFVNSTNDDIVLSCFSTTCGCVVTGEMAKTINGELSVVIPKATTYELPISYTNRGIPGDSLRHRISFVSSHDNDKHHIDLFIKKVTSTISTSPRVADFGTMEPGKFYGLELDVLDSSDSSRLVGNCISSNADVKVFLSNDNTVVSRDEDGRVSKRIAKIKLEYKAITPGKLNGMISIYLANGNGEPYKIYYLGSILDYVTVSPSSITLPKFDQSKLLYTDRISIKSNFGHDIRAVSISHTPLLLCNVLNDGIKDGGSEEIIIGVNLPKAMHSKILENVTRFSLNAKVEISKQRVIDVEIPVRILRR